VTGPSPSPTEPSKVPSGDRIDRKMRLMTTPLDARSLGEQIAEHVARDIIDGRIPEGTRVSEVELAARFGTSRSPVRDAVRILGLENLLDGSPRRQMTVVTFDNRSVANLYLVRSRLYGLAASLHATIGARSDQDVLIEASNDMIRASETTDQELFADANLRFHEVLFATCGNPLLERTLNGLGGLTTAYLQTRVRAVPGRLRDAGLGHLEAAEAIRDRDAFRAQQAMQGVIVGAGRSLIVHESGDAELAALLDIP